MNWFCIKRQEWIAETVRVFLYPFCEMCGELRKRGEHCTTYGVDKQNCAVAARVGEFFKYELMKWPKRKRP